MAFNPVYDFSVLGDPLKENRIKKEEEALEIARQIEERDKNKGGKTTATRKTKRKRV